MSIDNAVDGFGMYQKLDRAAMPAWGYYACFVLSIYLGGALGGDMEEIYAGDMGRYDDYARFVLSIYLGGTLGTWRGQTTPHFSQGGVRLERGC
mmetsp:Transcript_44483/g.144396  ORF Transcript_44483/g.144396 Transcript_44483/m.144396 type:complete len:94 (-) Transcript_44483:543-824(-)